jgi:hypothetical protein
MGMEDKYKKLLGSINLVEPPKGLENRIINSIKAEEKRAKRFKAWIFGSISLASFVLSLRAIVYLVESMKETGFGQYLSLLFSENGAALVYWKEITLSLAESLPVVGLVAFLTTVGLLIWSMAKVFDKGSDRNMLLRFN